MKKLHEEFKLYENMWDYEEANELTEAAGSGTIRCMFALYEDDDGYVCKVGVYAGNLSAGELEDLLTEQGMSFVTCWDEYEYTTSKTYNLGDVVEVFDVEDEDIEDVAAIAGKDPEEYKNVGFFESAKTKKPTELKEANDDVRSLIKKLPSKPVTPKFTPPAVGLDDYDDSEKVECSKCGAICIHSDEVGVPADLQAWDTAFGWYCEKCHNAQSEYEWSVETFENACNDSDFFLSAWSDDGDEISDENIDVITEIILDWNKAKKDPNCIYSTNPAVVKQMELRFIEHAKEANLDINPSVFKK